ncbi:hypothetical protein Ga0100231_005100 [Opitutaceae bacterium TAV4]|uniref:hypothetical protein n=1 Tax=Geminisphaera colitermitum TaxID=1148786 RepID=UPI000158C70A|nr:hypothetical protein [Geminisphaera colitermitum]RRJ97838.1 hypothetical protein Ga0100231_005100 [Opitutaceae bacterium TAV4]RRK00905.1 hypothetical protein Ga0100230_024345 [Opitutaceae bacterium TAV3]RRK02370.1 hypothetical protein Ga0100230_004235 [Opitutaceae bacterium TAV3]
MKLAKASQEEIDTLMRWLQARENAKFENAKDRPPAFSRVVFGYETLVNNCCDPTKDYLAWKPGYAPSDTDRYRSALEKIAALPTDQLASPDQCNAVAIAMDALNPKTSDQTAPEARPDRGLVVQLGDRELGLLRELVENRNIYAAAHDLPNYKPEQAAACMIEELLEAKAMFWADEVAKLRNTSPKAAG